MIFIAIFLGLTLTMLTGLNLASAAIQESSRRISDDEKEIQKDLRFNAQLRDLQGLRRVGDELTQYDTSEHVSAAREVKR